MARCTVSIKTQRKDFDFVETGDLLSVMQRYKRRIAVREPIEVLERKAGVAVLIPAENVDYVLIKEKEE